MPPKLIVEVVGDASSFERELKRAEKRAKGFNREIEQSGKGTRRATVAFAGMGKAGLAGAGAFFGAQGLTAGIQTSIDAASNLQEQVSKSRVVFGESSRDIEEWAKTTADGFGIARDQALTATGTFGNLFRTVKLAPRDAAVMSKALVELAADLASFNNSSPEEALDALRSGLVGEVEPLRRFGVLLSETRVQQEAMVATGKRSVKELTNQEKAMARYRLILKDTAPAQGDFARTQKGFANQTRILRARMRELSQEIGSVAIPALTVLVGALIDVTKRAKEASEALGDALGPNAPTGKLGAFAFDLADKLGLVADEADAVAAAYKRIDAQAKAAAASAGLFNSLSEGARNTPDNRATRPVGAAGEPPRLRAGATAEQRNDWFDAMIGRRTDRVQDVKTLQGQIAALKQIAALVRERLAATKDITRRLALEDELLDLRRQQESLRDQIASNAIDAKRLSLEQQRARIEEQRAAAEKARAAAQERREKMLAKIKSSQFRALGFADDGSNVVPGVARLRRELGTIGEAVKGTFLDTSKTKSVMSQIRKVLSGGLGAVSRDVRAKIKEMLDAIDQQLKDRQQRQTRFKAVDTSQVLAGLGLNADQIRSLRGRISQIGRDGKVPTRGGGAFGIAVPLAGRAGGGGDLHVRVDLQGKQVGNVVLRDFQKRGRQTSAQRGGRNAGLALGLG